ncbi:molybdopterin-guanine dinucleotide biosynthesis protein A [Alicyclobacillus sacchari]|uniref:Molybdopterin-guanine dinucleotide biosynthesis protein A n=1 Tax=Alicyclobacillus sacchari TaxID=392010 RepID=A0A4R8LSB6_9BACL|nr:molybdenum cofactor guanylyltransferase [Alicyclobacillus sacchari]TDY49982.1 molybdopterin-guanine dinucleotide biosynthesis protein A [Alicyclobacillus sacchari]
MIVLAGGQSRRMAEYGNKLALARDPSGVPVLAHVIRVALAVCDDVIVSYNDAALRTTIAPWLSKPVAWELDPVPWQGPLQALGAVLGTRADSLATFQLIAGDLPGITPHVLEALCERLSRLHVDGVAAVREGRLQPLCAVYRQNVATAFIEAARQGERRLLSALFGLSIAGLEFSHQPWAVRPIHTPDDYRAWLTEGGCM